MLLPVPSPPEIFHTMKPFTDCSSEGGFYYAKQPSNCVICGGIANCRHFGAFSCNACAAFFRRTVAKKKNYVCAHHGNCVIDAGFVRRICRACRLVKCLAFGMQESEVLSPGLPQSTTKLNNDSPSDLVESSNSSLSPYTPPVVKPSKIEHFPVTVDTSNECLHKLFYTNEVIFHRRSSMLPPTQNGTRPSVLSESAQHVTNEAHLFRMFLNMSGLSEIIDLPDINGQMSEIVLYWCSSQCLLNTLKFNTISEKRFTLIDNSYIEVNEESMLQWHSGVPFLRKDLQCLASISVPLFKRIENISTQISDAVFTPEECVFFLILSLIEAIIKYSTNTRKTREKFNSYKNRVFRSMRQYYKENYSDETVATRIGELVMLLPLLNELHHILGEHRSLLQLCNWRLEHLANENLYDAFHNRCQSPSK